MPLFGSRLKVRRADIHLHELIAAITAFLDRKPYGLLRDFDPQNNLHTVRASIADQPDPAIASIVGDILHNLRAALDHLAVDLTREGFRLKGERMSRTAFDEAGFPVYANRALFETSGSKKIKNWPPVAQTLIAELEPFKDGGHEWSTDLWCLHQLDILDKHKMLVPAASLAYDLSWSTGPTEAALKEKGFWNSGPFRLAAYNERTFPAKDGDVIVAIESADPDFQFNLGANFEVAFGTEQVLDGEPVLITLQRLGRVVDSIIETMAAKVFSTPQHNRNYGDTELR